MMSIPYATRNRFACLLMLLPLLLIAVVGCGGSGDDDSLDARPRVEKIVFASDEEGFRGINTISPDGTGRRLVFPARDFTGLPAFSPDGTKIAFLSDRENCGGVGCSTINDQPYPLQVWLINADGTGLRQLTRRTDFSADRLSFSPDGSRVLYSFAGFLSSRVATGRGGQPEYACVLRSVNLDGGADTLVAGGSWPADIAWPRGATLSPDGAKVAVVSNVYDGAAEYTGSDIFVMNADGSGEATRLANNGATNFAPSFSPDGTRIAFARNQPTDSYSRSEICVMNADGSGQTRLTNKGGRNYAPSFSPDGSKIVFLSSGVVGNVDATTSRMFVMNADGTDQRPILVQERATPYDPMDGISHGAWALTRAR